MSKIIETITAYVAVDASGDEGIMGVHTTDGWVPLIGADEERLESMYKIAMQISHNAGLPIRIYRWQNREDITDDVNLRYGKV